MMNSGETAEIWRLTNGRAVSLGEWDGGGWNRRTARRSVPAFSGPSLFGSQPFRGVLAAPAAGGAAGVIAFGADAADVFGEAVGVFVGEVEGEFVGGGLDAVEAEVIGYQLLGGRGGRRTLVHGELALFGGFGEVLVDALGDDVVGDLAEIGVEELGEFEILWPEDGVEEGLFQPDHNGGVALAGEAVGFELVAADEGEEELAFPGVGEAELELLRFAGEGVELDVEAFEGGVGGGHFAEGVGAEEEGLHLGDLVEEFVAGHGPMGGKPGWY
jgi:hypothetical protein